MKNLCQALAWSVTTLRQALLRQWLAWPLSSGALNTLNFTDLATYFSYHFHRLSLENFFPEVRPALLHRLELTAPYIYQPICSISQIIHQLREVASQLSSGGSGEIFPYSLLQDFPVNFHRFRTFIAGPFQPVFTVFESLHAHNIINDIMKPRPRILQFSPCPSSPPCIAKCLIIFFYNPMNFMMKTRAHDIHFIREIDTTNDTPKQ